MRDGGKILESHREREKDIDTEKGISHLCRRANADEFGRAVAKIAVAQICESVGFQSFNESALESLADVAVRYLRDLGKTANSHANLAGRTECNVFDVIQGLEDLGSSVGFPGSDTGLSGSGALRGVVEYVDSAEENPFAQPVPHFPVVRDRRGTPSFLQMSETPAFKHIPDWLPAFPDPHTYIHSPMWNERASDPRADKIELARQRRKAESSLLSLQQRLVRNGSMVASTSADLANGRTNASPIAESKNPFLAVPLQVGEKDVSPVVMPTKLSDDAVVHNHVSVLQTFAPAIEAMKDGFCDLGESVENNIPNRRPAVHLKFKTGSKFIGGSLDLSLRSKGAVGKTASWFGRDDEKDDKKRRAELILRHNMENPQELPQL